MTDEELNQKIEKLKKQIDFLVFKMDEQGFTISNEEMERFTNDRRK